ncbi:DNA polymerase IV [Enterovirga rhinocerotis]
MAVAAPRIACRDCETLDRARDGRCLACGSPRLASHPELSSLSIAHVDCDAFYASVEKRDHPELQDKPVIVGGGQRGVVSTACYIARIHGVHSAMPMFKALRACPQAIVLKPDFPRYVKVSREVRRLMLELTPLVEPLSIDEAFLDLGGTETVHGAVPAVSLIRFAARVEREIGISVSVGLAPNKFLAKIASDRGKPRGFSVIGRAEAADFLADQPITIMPGIGRQTQARLEKAGITLVRHLRERSLHDLAGALGREGDRLARLARGEDPRRVEPHHEAKSISAETTFNQDLAALADLEPILWRLCEKVSRRLKAATLAGTSVTLKLKDRHFQTVTRTRSGLPATQLARRLYEPARALLRATATGAAYRLIGIGAGDLCGAEFADLGDLADPDVGEQARMEAAIDRLRDKFGPETVQTGLAFPFRQR